MSEKRVFDTATGAEIDPWKRIHALERELAEANDIILKHHEIMGPLISETARPSLATKIQSVSQSVSGAVHVSFGDAGRGFPNFASFAAWLLAEVLVQSPRAESDAEIQLQAWHRVFETSQLSHAHARLQAAEEKVARLSHTEQPHDLKRVAYVLGMALLQSSIITDDETIAARDYAVGLGKDRSVMFDTPRSTPAPQVSNSVVKDSFNTAAASARGDKTDG